MMPGQLFNNGLNWVVAGIVAAAVIPALTFGIKIPFLVALGIGLTAFFGLVLLLAPRGLFEGVDVSTLNKGKLDLVRKVLMEATPALERLDAASRRIRNPAIRKGIQDLTSTARTIFERIEQNPERMISVQRFLTYYLPAAAELAESYGVLEQQRSPDTGRLQQSEAVLGKLNEAFGHYADTMLESDLSGLDVDLRLIERAVKDDLEARP
ncbi:MAG: 5-bromo-4-chloroindolyl phosphate hydrolysis family protein [Alphaproteobacteria bacterium]|uniref:5-bromo-4-chloroindolyl phosphate hydrolysis family protein n=1 Tax=Aestuariivirga sp. TaxID=2650926 RepID=UPI003017F444|nr:5-bromo-4-chloroindolyl phosphate hydrolysis family protein [Alphaproteobacteria bacterium]